MDKLKQFFEWIRTKPTWFRVVWLVLILGLALVLSLASCARSAMLFRGNGDLEYYYKGSDAEIPQHLVDNDQTP